MSSRTDTRPTAMAAGYMRCHDCGKLVLANNSCKTGTQLCTRCYAQLHFRQPNSISRTWALILCAAILLFPANLLPIMQVDFMSRKEYSTIMDGIVYFFHTGEYGIGLIIFIASVLVPLFKVIGMTLILLSIHFKWKTWLRHKAAMYRFIQFIGRWSMLDVFVIAVMGALLHFGSLSATSAAPAASYFTAVVVCSMFAAITFDPRLLWDA